MQRFPEVKPVSEQDSHTDKDRHAPLQQQEVQHEEVQQKEALISGGQQRFAFSANRGNARHRLRYKEGDAALLQSDDCFFCRSGS